MRNFKSEIEGSWKESVVVNFTQLERDIINGKVEDKAGLKPALLEKFHNEREVEPTEQDLSTLVSLYNSKKPTLKETDTYRLISASITLSGTVGKGLINCWVNDEHTQIRF